MITADFILTTIQSWFYGKGIYVNSLNCIQLRNQKLPAVIRMWNCL